MPRCSSRNQPPQPSCSCLVDAFRNFPALIGPGRDCASPDCPVRTLDSLTLHQFLEAIGTADNAGAEAGPGDGRESPIIVAMESRRRRPKLNHRRKTHRISR